MTSWTKGISVSLIFKRLLWHDWYISSDLFEGLGRRRALWLHSIQPNTILFVKYHKTSRWDLQTIRSHDSWTKQYKENKETSHDEAADIESSVTTLCYKPLQDSELSFFIVPSVHFGLSRKVLYHFCSGQHGSMHRRSSSVLPQSLFVVYLWVCVSWRSRTVINIHEEVHRGFPEHLGWQRRPSCFWGSEMQHSDWGTERSTEQPQTHSEQRHQAG